MILHDAIKTIRNKVFPFSLKKEQNVVSSKKNKKNCLKKKNPGGLGFFEKTHFFSTLIRNNVPKGVKK